MRVYAEANWVRLMIIRYVVIYTTGQTGHYDDLIVSSAKGMSSIPDYHANPQDPSQQYTAA